MTTIYSSRGPVCPHCEHQHIADDDPECHYDGMLTEVECDSCKHVFGCTVDFQWMWFSERQEVQP